MSIPTLPKPYTYGLMLRSALYLPPHTKVYFDKTTEDIVDCGNVLGASWVIQKYFEYVPQS
jgi:hypothetical protein